MASGREEVSALIGGDGVDERPMANHSPSTVRSAALRSSALRLENAISIGLKSGL